jgi:hypothetical protein
MPEEAGNNFHYGKISLRHRINLLNNFRALQLAHIMQIIFLGQQQLQKRRYVMSKGLGCFRFSSLGFCVVEVCHGQENGRDFFVILAIEPQSYRYFKKRYQPGETSNFAGLGYELIRGWGKAPSEDVMEKLAVKHGVEFGVSDNFLNRLIGNFDPLPMPLARLYAAGMPA